MLLKEEDRDVTPGLSYNLSTVVLVDVIWIYLLPTFPLVFAKIDLES
jgi:hypothetical protein